MRPQPDVCADLCLALFCRFPTCTGTPVSLLAAARVCAPAHQIQLAKERRGCAGHLRLQMGWSMWEFGCVPSAPHPGGGGQLSDNSQALRDIFRAQERERERDVFGDAPHSPRDPWRPMARLSRTRRPRSSSTAPALPAGRSPCPPRAPTARPRPPCRPRRGATLSAPPPRGQRRAAPRSSLSLSLSIFLGSAPKRAKSVRKCARARAGSTEGVSAGDPGARGVRDRRAPTRSPHRRQGPSRCFVPARRHRRAGAGSGHRIPSLLRCTNRQIRRTRCM